MASTSALLTTAITSRLHSTLRLLLFTGFLLLGSLLLGMSPAQAEEGHAGKVNTAGPPLTERAGPGTDYAKTGRQLADGASITIVCQTQGSKVTGTYGTSTWWDKISTGGYVSDTYVYTGSDGRVAPLCTDGAKAPEEAATAQEQAAIQQSAIEQPTAEQTTQAEPLCEDAHPCDQETLLRRWMQQEWERQAKEQRGTGQPQGFYKDETLEKICTVADGTGIVAGGAAAVLKKLESEIKWMTRLAKLNPPGLGVTAVCFINDRLPEAPST